MFLIVRTATDGGTVYWYTNQELNAWVKACTVAYDYAAEIESPSERLKFYQALEKAIGCRDEERIPHLRTAMAVYAEVNEGTEIDVIPIDGYCGWRVLPPEVVNDITISIEQCLNPALEEAAELRQAAEEEDVPFMPDFTVSVKPADTQ